MNDGALCGVCHGSVMYARSENARENDARRRYHVNFASPSFDPKFEVCLLHPFLFLSLPSFITRSFLPSFPLLSYHPFFTVPPRAAKRLPNARWDLARAMTFPIRVYSWNWSWCILIILRTHLTSWGKIWGYIPHSEIWRDTNQDSALFYNRFNQAIGQWHELLIDISTI